MDLESATYLQGGIDKPNAPPEKYLKIHREIRPSAIPCLPTINFRAIGKSLKFPMNQETIAQEVNSNQTTSNPMSRVYLEQRGCFQGPNLRNASQWPCTNVPSAVAAATV